MTWEQALAKVAAENPALAALLIHNHDCIEDMKRMQGMMDARQEQMTKLIWAVLAASIGSLISTLAGAAGFLLWQIISHGTR